MASAFGGVVLILVCSCVLSCNAKQDLTLPDYVDVCYRDDPKLPECIKRAIEKLVPIFKSGSSDFELDPLDPMTYHDLVFKFDGSLLGGVMTVPKFIATGVANLKAMNVRPKINDRMMILEFNSVFPEIVTYANYSLNGNLLSSRIKVKGAFNFKFENLTVSHTLICGVKTNDKKDYLYLKLFSGHFRGDNIQKVTALNDNLIEGKPALNGILKGLLKNAWRPLMNQMLPAIQPRTDIMLTQKFVKFFSKYPYDVIFPKRKV